MNRIRQLKKELGEKYLFERLLSVREVKKLFEQDMGKFSAQVIQSMTAGCVKPCLGYDVFVKDCPDSSEWICYDSPNDPGSFREEDMLAVLDRVVQENRLSYTECCFEKLDGKIFEKKTAAATFGDRDRL